MVKSPIVTREVRNIGRYCWRKCPYSTIDNSNRIPIVERTPHYVTSGNMDPDIRDGHDNFGFVCKDPGCSFYLGTATTPITIKVRNLCVDSGTGYYKVDFIDVVVPICSGTHFWEK